MKARQTEKSIEGNGDDEKSQNERKSYLIISDAWLKVEPENEGSRRRMGASMTRIECWSTTWPIEAEALNINTNKSKVRLMLRTCRSSVILVILNRTGHA